MMVKQIDLHKALELAGKGNEVLVLLPNGSDTGWKDYLPGTLQDMLEGCLFFRREPAMENTTFSDAVEDAVKQESNTPPPPPTR